MAGKNKQGRKNYYEERIKPRLKEIEEWYSLGVSEEQVYKNLGVTRSTWYKHKAEQEELKEAIKRGCMPVIIKVRSALYKSALGFTYTERKVYKKKEPTGDGNFKEVGYEEISEKYAPPNVASCNLLLKNLDKENWANDPQMLKMKELELKHKQQVLESSVFEDESGENEIE